MHVEVCQHEHIHANISTCIRTGGVLRGMSRQAQEVSSKATATANEVLGNIRTVRYGLHRHKFNRSNLSIGTVVFGEWCCPWNKFDFYVWSIPVGIVVISDLICQSICGRGHWDAALLIGGGWVSSTGCITGYLHNHVYMHLLIQFGFVIRKQEITSTLLVFFFASLFALAHCESDVSLLSMISCFVM